MRAHPLRVLTPALSAIALVTSLGLGACGAGDEDLATVQAEPTAPAGVARAALGESDGDYPNLAERQFLYLANRARIDPKNSDVCKPYLDPANGANVAGYDGVNATPPLAYNLDLNHVARFHAREMAVAPCFRHPSCGYLIGQGLEACSSAKPASQGGSCTKDQQSYCKGYDSIAKQCVDNCPDDAADKDPELEPFHRFSVLGYHGGTMGENIAAQTFPDSSNAFCGFWLEGPTGGPNTAATHGHFENLVNGKFTEVGHGYWQNLKAAKCEGAKWTDLYSEDFGGNSVAADPIPSASHWRSQGTTQPTFGAIWNAKAPPKEISVVLPKGATQVQCVKLNLKAGTANRGAYEYTAAMPTGCQQYYFKAVDADGETILYPDTGSLLVGSDCTSAWTTARSYGDCVKAPPADAGTDPNDPTGGGAGDDGEVQASCAGCGVGAPPMAAGLLGLAAMLWRRRRG